MPSRITRILRTSALVLVAAGVPALPAPGGDALPDGFVTPPDASRPFVYWFWLDGNVTTEGITADLEAMHRVGLGGAIWMWGGGVGGGSKGPIGFMSPDWWAAMRHMVREADRLGLMIDITNGSGWSHSGGPWVRPEDGMRRLESVSAIRSAGPGRREIAIPGGGKLVGVLAHRLRDPVEDAMSIAGVEVTATSSSPAHGIDKALDRDPDTRWISRGSRSGEGPTEADPQSIVFTFPRPFTAASMSILPFTDCGPRACQLEASDDGGRYRTVARFELAPRAERTIPFPETSARTFRLRITSAHPFQGQEAWNVQVAEIRLDGKGEGGHPFTAREILQSRSMIDLTRTVDQAGRLVWDVPEGVWSIQIVRDVPSGDRPHPILPDEGGLECDKLDPGAVEANWNGFVRRILDECGPAARRVIRWVHADSYEFGPQTWTARMRQEFTARCGYDPLPFLPAVLGKIVDGPETTARFLWDFRRIRADLFAEGIGAHLRDLCRREGISLTTEPHLVPDVFDQIQYGGHVSEPVGNFLAERRTRWYAENPPVGPEVHLAKGEASAAATYGLDGIVWAEAFTGVDHAHAWKETPEYLKVWGDLWFTEGINRFAFHCWAHSPPLDRRPGITLGPWGIHFDRRNTWFELARGYLTYIARCQFLLQRGLPVADIAMLTGDGVTAEFPRHPELRARGFDYHGLTAEVLVRDAAVEDGSITLPSGMRYRLLAVYAREMRPATIRKLRELVLAGATVMGTKPVDAPGLSGFPAAGEEVRRIAEELWGPGGGAPSNVPFAGRGTVFQGVPERPVLGTSGCGPAAYFSCAREIEVLRSIGVMPDMEYRSSGKEDGDHMLAYAHRRIGSADVYFLTNQSSRRRTEECIFRTAGRRPELWDPVTGGIRDLPVHEGRDGRTAIPLEFEPGQSYFIVFRRPVEGERGSKSPGNFPAMKIVRELAGPWRVSFDPRWGGPASAVTFEKLEDWSKRAEDGIRHYSGLAAYRTTFDLPAVPDGRKLFLDLGRVKDLGEVRLNGRSLGVVWCDPWSVEITEAARPGSNDLEVVIANEWVNRLIGDAGRPQEQRLTWTTWNPYQPDSPLLESGLLGPVRLTEILTGTGH